MIKNMKINKRDIPSEFNDEAQKLKMFWELESVENGIYHFKNINYELSGKL